ncbi:sensor domain-containing diguanylate cyclase [Rhizobium lusitanum]|uniref:diguanylate cyclase n=1 Tax=Rhizobium lusitanum TaxID=293958 RepID=A0A7X0IU45_9HYPH|nr:GGDEF domain-containing protein [Rhizobium lusitanum]MBB6487129.1 diguanylate cyclase (GGDEF)-like protein [Rhizobium lusitanum]
MSYIVLGVLNPAMSAIFSISLLALWWQHRRLPYIAIFASSYAIRTVCFIIAFIALNQQTLPLRLVSNALILLTMVLLSVGISQKYKKRPHYTVLVIIVLATLSGLGFYTVVHDSLVARAAIIGLGLAAICLTILDEIPERPKRTSVESLLFWLVAASAITFGCRPLFAMPSLVGEDFESAYWLAISISDTLICSTLAVSIFAIIAVDVTEKIRSEAERDYLSGLLNRRGFERHANAILHARSNRGSSALIVSDLDLFKSINDRFGHATGDRVIQCFAELLSHKSPPGAILARLGGEEFAILLPSSDLGLAHQVAEDLRQAFKVSAPGIVQGGLCPTASFGIAAASGAEELGVLLDHADRALYRAKTEGRDCVRSFSDFDGQWSALGEEIRSGATP